MIDSHCHLDDARLAPHLLEHLAEARAAGVTGFVSAGVHGSGWRKQVALTQGRSDVWHAFGIHPGWVGRLEPPLMEEQLAELPGALAGELGVQAVALGETGLHRVKGTSSTEFEEQERVFVYQLGVARTLNLPVVLHVVGAHERTLQIIRREGLPASGGVVHSYSGSAELVRSYVACGLCLSFSGVVTWPGARRSKEALTQVPEDNLLVETDAPDQAPFPYKKRENRPALLDLVVREVAALRKMSFGDVEKSTSENAKRLFDLDTNPASGG